MSAPRPTAAQIEALRLAARPEGLRREDDDEETIASLIRWEWVWTIAVDRHWTITDSGRAALDAAERLP